MNMLDNIGNIIYENTRYDNITLLKQISYIRERIRKHVKRNENSTIGILLERNPYMITSMIASFCEGIPFVFIEKDFPDERQRYMLDSVGVNCLITSTEIQHEFFDIESIYIEEVPGDIEIIDDEEPFDHEKTAYYIFTSGTTGKPKAVALLRKGLLNFIEAIPEVIELNPNMNIGCFTNNTFDIFLLESFMALVIGLTVVLANDEEQNNARLLSNLITYHKIDVIQMTPSKLKLLQMYDKNLSCLQEVTTVLVGGEVFPKDLLLLLQKNTKAKLYNMYGPTETTIWSSVSELTNKSCIDIGYPIKNTDIYIMDSELNILPAGEVGEICIAGDGVARGYFKNDEQTKKSFVYRSDDVGTRLYRTGDLGKYDEFGLLHCFGRMDNQIKLRGHRIELEDIDSNVVSYSDLIAAVTCFKDSDTGGELITYYLSNNTIDEKKLIQYLQQKLPQYMIPKKYKRVSRFLYTTSGKIDRKAMMEETDDLLIHPDYNNENVATTNNEIQNVILNIFHDVLGDSTEYFNCDTELIELGIDSINFVTIVIQLEEHFNIEFEHTAVVMTAFKNINEIADYIGKLKYSDTRVSC